MKEKSTKDKVSNATYPRTIVTKKEHKTTNKVDGYKWTATIKPGFKIIIPSEEEELWLLEYASILNWQYKHRSEIRAGFKVGESHTVEIPSGDRQTFVKESVAIEALQAEFKEKYGITLTYEQTREIRKTSMYGKKE